MGKLNVEQLEDRRMLTITVDTLVDELDGSIIDGDISLRDAIAAAPAGEMIDFSVSGTILLDAALGELKIDKDLTIDGPGPDQLTIDASTADPTPGFRDGNGIRIFNIDDGQENSAIVVRLSNMTLTGGDVTGDGGAINSVETLHLQNSRITGNSARGAGGGLNSLIQYGIGNLYVTQSTFLDNFATGSGGGMNARTEFAYFDDGPRVQVLNSHFEDNRAARGGGVYFTDIGEVIFLLRNTTLQGNTASASGGGVELRVGGANGNLAVEQCVISNNRAAHGGGIRFLPLGMGGRMYLRNSEVTHNTATNDGGGVHARGEESRVSISGSEISENVAGARGGGVWATADYGSVSVSTSTVSGNSASDGGGIAMGAGFLAGLSIRSVNVRQNVASETGGGILLLGEAVVDTSTIYGNSAGDEGGGIYVSGSFASYYETYETIVARSTISANVATRGGGLRLVANGGPITISDSTISGNSALESAGGISATADEVVDGTINIDRATIVFNVASGFGGGVHHETGILSVAESTVAENFSGNGGGGISMDDGSVEIFASTISGNESESKDARGAGGISVYAGLMQISNSTVSGNTATITAGTGQFSGGGIANVMGSLIVRHSTIADNSITSASASSPATGGGISGPATLDHTIVADNFAQDEGHDLFGTFDARYSLIEDPAGAMITDNGGVIIDVDPALGPLRNNGGRTETHALLGVGGAYNAGDPAASAGAGDVPLSDQRGVGFQRIREGRIDIGAVEVAAPPPLVCDFDQDNRCDIEDLDALIAALAAGINDPTFDLTGNGGVNLADRNQWLVEAGALNLDSGNPYLLADANLDGVVDGNDFLAWNAHKFSATGKWSQGDWNADGNTDGQDVLIWDAHRFQSSGSSQRGNPVAPLTLPTPTETGDPLKLRPTDELFAQLLAQDAVTEHAVCDE